MTGRAAPCTSAVRLATPRAQTTNAFAVFSDGTGPALHIGGSFQVAYDLVSNHVARWNGCPPCPADLGGDGNVGITDFLAVLAAWGPCL